MVCYSTITKYYRMGGLNNGNLFLTVLEAGRSKIEVLVDLVPGEDPLVGRKEILSLPLPTRTLIPS
jgi:hypothetical protein